jgi:TRAP-type C4-dicarboxylate transport system permease small subunit
VLELVTIASLAVMFVSILIGVVDRFVLGIGLPWPEELARFLLVWGSLLSAAIAAKHKAHFQLTVVIRHLGVGGAVVVDAIAICALLLVVGYGIQFAWIFRVQTSPALGISMSWVYAAAPVSAALIVGYLVRDIVTRVRARVRGRELAQAES